MKWYKRDQHFLIDKKVLNRIVEYGRLDSSDTVLEIGAGYGNLTEELAKRAGKVIAVEADAEFAASLNRWKNVEVIIGDVLKIEFSPFNKVISNLPYSISSPVTFKLLRYKFDFGILMYQYEFAKRMVALPESKDYSRLSIAVQYYADAEILEVVPRSAFSIPPQVRSAIVKLTPRSAQYKVKDEDFFMKFINAAFSQRRKKLRNAILNNADLLGIKDIRDALKKLPSDLIGKRAENLSPQELANLADILSNQMKIAVVFDSAGTLLRMYRVAKNIRTGEYLNEVVSTELVGKKPYCAILVMQVDSPKLMNCPHSMLISDFIKKFNVDIEVGCSRIQIEKTAALDAVENDTRASMKDLQDVMKAVKRKCKNIFYMGVGLIIDVDTNSIPYVICTGGRVYSNTSFVINTLNERNIDAYIASGDSMRNLSPLAKNVNIPFDHVFEIATPKKKEEIVKRLKHDYDKVIMVGDGINDILAFRAADLGVLSIQQTGKCPPLLCEEADIVIRDIKEIIDILPKQV